ncbi:MAG: methionine synthase [Firmicutes bacterium]|nr:methionine synthase [Bacillota bacterium]
MVITLPNTIDREEWLKFLHVKGEPEEELKRRLDQAEKQLLQAADPRAIYRVMDRAAVATEGFSIQKHLEGCSRVAVLAVTIGVGIDQLIVRTQLTSMALAVVLDAGASVLAEQAADAAESLMKSELADRFPGMFTTSRFSPGYGDFPIRRQREILQYADAPRKIGVTLTAGDMMVPHKSVTALIGLADHPVTGRLAPCSECVLRGKCTFLKEGRHC